MQSAKLFHTKILYAMSISGVSTVTLLYKTSDFITPGPGAYMPPSDFGKAPAWTIK